MRQHSGPGSRTRGQLGPLFAVLALSAAFAPTVFAAGAQVTRGDVHPFATGAALPITGRAQMIRTADGKTIVSIHVEGLAPGATYGSHVHKQSCADENAGLHYRFDPAGAGTPPNEIWPGPFIANAAGVGNADAIALEKAGPEAVSVVVHALGGAKIACADLG